MYTEALLIAEYCYRAPDRLGCAFVQPLAPYTALLGVHSSALRALPQLLVYLATLMHTNALARRQVIRGAAAPLPSLFLFWVGLGPEDDEHTRGCLSRFCAR